MYVKINKTKYRGTEYYRAFLVRSVRTAKGPRHEVVCNFGRVSSDEGERLKRSFKLVDDKKSIIARREEFRTVSSFSLGDVYAVFGQFKPLGIDKVMDKSKDK